MKKPLHFFLFAAVLTVVINARPLWGMDELRLLIPEFRPYSYETEGSVQGVGMQALQSVLKDSGIPYSSIVVSSQDMAVSETRSGNADGFFPVPARSDRDSFAQYFGPFISHRWTWFLPAESTYNPLRTSFKPYARVGTLQHSATSSWLRNNGYHITGQPSSAEALILMMKKGTINAILMPEVEFLKVIEAAGEQPGQYRMVVQFETPLGLYVSKAFLDKNPGVMERLTRALEKLPGGHGK